jgi:type IV secretion system protein VirB2
MPWETPLDNIVKSLTGPVAKGLGTLAMVFFGLALAWSEGPGLRAACAIVFGLTLAFNAAVWAPTFFGFSGAAAAMIDQTSGSPVHGPTE